MKASKLFLILSMAALVTACSEDDIYSDDSSNGSGIIITDTSVSSDALNFSISMDESDRDTYKANAETVPTNSSASDYEDYVENFTTRNTVTITYSASGDATWTMDAANDSVSISATGNDVVVTSSAKGINYVLQGTATDGSFKMADGDDDKKFRLTLNGVSLTKSSGAAINIQPSKRCYLCLADGTQNSVATTGSYSGSDEDQKGAIFSEGKLLVSGSGTLSVTADAMHGICSDAYLWVHDGDIDITTSAKDGIHANDSVVIGGGQIDISSYGDGIQVEGEASTYVQHGGFVKITATSNGDDRSHGIKAEGTAASVDISNGALQVSVSDNGAKAVKADGAVNISGGRLTLLTSGAAVIDSGDSDYTSSSGIKADGVFTISGGEVQAYSTGNGGKGLSGDATATISGGTVKIITTGSHVGASSGGMGPGSSSSSNSASSSPKGIKVDGNLTISGGTILVQTTGGEGAEGIESKATITISGGTTGISAYDDGINASKAIVQTGGFLYACGTNNDGIDSNGTITVKGGVMIGSGTTSPEEGIDIDNGSISCSGGIVISMGGVMNSSPVVTSGQTYIAQTGLSWSKNTYCRLVTNSGNIYFRTDRSMSQGAIMVSSPDITSGNSYSLCVGGSLSNSSISVFGYATDGTYSGGSSYSVTAGTSSGGGFNGGGGSGDWH